MMQWGIFTGQVARHRDPGKWATSPASIAQARAATLWPDARGLSPQGDHTGFRASPFLGLGHLRTMRASARSCSSSCSALAVKPFLTRRVFTSSA